MAIIKDKTTKDPVCGMTISPKDVTNMSQQAGSTYYFCSESCKKKFEDNPSKYVQNLRDHVRSTTSADRQRKTFAQAKNFRQVLVEAASELHN